MDRSSSKEDKPQSKIGFWTSPVCFYWNTQHPWGARAIALQKHSWLPFFRKPAPMASEQRRPQDAVFTLLGNQWPCNTNTTNNCTRDSRGIYSLGSCSASQAGLPHPLGEGGLLMFLPVLSAQLTHIREHVLGLTLLPQNSISSIIIVFISLSILITVDCHILEAVTYKLGLFYTHKGLK